MKQCITALLLPVLLLLSPLAVAEVYRWVDEKGKVHFGDKAPAADAKIIKVTPPKGVGKLDTPPSGQDFREVQQKLLDSYDAKRELKKETQEKEKQKLANQEKALAKKCKETKAYLDIGGGVYDTDASGQRIFLKESEIAAYREQKQAEYDKNCR